jgi:hypothetical protein
MGFETLATRDDGAVLFWDPSEPGLYLIRVKVAV